MIWLLVGLVVAPSVVLGAMIGYRIGRVKGETETARWYEGRRRYDGFDQ